MKVERSITADRLIAVIERLRQPRGSRAPADGQGGSSPGAAGDWCPVPAHRDRDHPPFTRSTQPPPPLRWGLSAEGSALFRVRNDLLQVFGPPGVQVNFGSTGQGVRGMYRTPGELHALLRAMSVCASETETNR